MKEKIKLKFSRNLVISYICGMIFIAVMAVILLWRDSWLIDSLPTLISDAFFIGAVCFILLFVICMASRAEVFGHVSYLAQKRSARKNKTLPKYRTYQDYMENRPRSGFDARLFWIPGLTFFAVAIIFTFFAI